MPDDVSNYTSEALDGVVRSRLERATAQIQHSLEQVARGNPLGAETDEERAVSRIRLRTHKT